MLLSAILGVFCWKFHRQAQESIILNEAVQQENLAIDYQNKQLENNLVQLTQACESKEKELKSLIERAQIQSNLAQSMKSLSEQLQADAKQKAQEAYEQQKEKLDAKFQQEKEEQERAAVRDMERVQSRLKAESRKLADIEAKQLTYLEAQKRAEEIQAQKDYYRLVLTDVDIQDIKMLRTLQPRFTKKDSIDKLIWEAYYKAAYDLLMTHLFSSTVKVCGIYKITNFETGQAYIGQSVDIKERFRTHLKTALSCGPSTNKLYQEMKKYGPENFSFEILEEVPRTQLNEREIYWIDFYKTKDYGLNSTKGGS